jgi:hypothetical protein
MEIKVGDKVRATTTDPYMIRFGYETVEGVVAAIANGLTVVQFGAHGPAEADPFFAKSGPKTLHYFEGEVVAVSA